MSAEVLIWNVLFLRTPFSRFFSLIRVAYILSALMCGYRLISSGIECIVCIPGHETISF